MGKLDAAAHEGAARALAVIGDRMGEAAGWDGPAIVIRLDRPDGAADGTVEVAVMALDGSPADALRGFVAPATTLALGVVAHGWATSLDRSDGSGRQRVRVTSVVDRAGAVAGRLRWQDGRVLRDPPTEGRVVDRLRSALGVGRPD